MAKEYEVEINGQPAWYSNQVRKFKMYFAEPDNQVNSETGILLLIAGYGGNANSHVYRKMRQKFADMYNFVTLQCDYLGWQFMQDDQHLTITEQMLRRELSPREFRNLEKDYAGNQKILQGKVFSGKIDLGENADRFNEMGMCQAMDHLMALQVLRNILEENGLAYCKDRVYIYGQSHGAYLAYLCNRLAPDMFAGIIDNSAYLLPYYLNHDRQITKVGPVFSLQKIYHYLIADQEIDRESYDLRYLYKGFHNMARIICYHGMDDEMIPLEEKRLFLANVENVTLHVVSGKDVDGEIFQSTGHSLGADMLKVFEMALPELEGTKRKGKHAGNVPDTKIITNQYIYRVDRTMGVPVLYREPVK